MISHQITRRILALTRGPAENRTRRKHDFQAPSRFYGNDGTKFPKNCLRTLLAKTGEVANTWRIGSTMPGSSKETLGQKAVARSQHSIRLVERNGAFERASRVENTVFTGAEARAGLGVIAFLGKPAQRPVPQKLANRS